MLKHPTLDQLHALGLHGMAKAFADLADAGQAKDLAHADWLALLLDREASWRRDKRLTTRLRAAKLRQQASVEDVDYRAVRGLVAPFSKSSPRATGSKPTTTWPWSAQPASEKVGWLAPSARKLAATIDPSCTIAGRSSARIWRSPVATAAPRLIKSLGRADLLILDDFGPRRRPRHDLLELLKERYGRRSTIVTSQLPLSAWHEIIGDPTYADAILDRLVHNAHRIELTGESLRRTRGKHLKTA